MTTTKRKNEMRLREKALKRDMLKVKVQKSKPVRQVERLNVEVIK